MKKRSFQSVPGAFVVPATLWCTPLFFAALLVYCFYDNQMDPFIFCVSVAFSIGSVLCAVYSCQYTMCKVVLFDRYLLCKIPFARNIELLYDKCYIGMDYHIQNGWKVWWIYLSYGKMPPYKNPHLGNRINSVKCQPGFVRIMYRKEVYAALLDVLPKKQRTALISAYRCSGLQNPK